MVGVAAPESRLSSEKRREQVVEAAVHEFAEHGYHAARTAAIAERAGISQPYIYALFRDKKALFLACQDRVRAKIRATFLVAARQAGAARVDAEGVEDCPQDVLRRLAASWRKLLPDHDLMQCQLQGFAAAADPEIRENVRQGVMASFDAVAELSGASRDQVATFVGRGLLLNIGATLGLPAEYLPGAVPLAHGAAHDSSPAAETPVGSSTDRETDGNGQPAN